jgi:hypothetical protein
MILQIDQAEYAEQKDEGEKGPVIRREIALVFFDQSK